VATNAVPRGGPLELLDIRGGIYEARVRVADIGGKEFHIAPDGLVAEVGDAVNREIEKEVAVTGAGR
jgi:hypothetical protein